METKDRDENGLDHTYHARSDRDHRLPPIVSTNQMNNSSINETHNMMQMIIFSLA